MSTSISFRLNLLGFSGIAAVVVIGFAARWGLQNADRGLAQTVQVTQAVQSFMEYDMMHDAIRADVLAALLAEDEKAKAEVRQEFADHKENFRNSIAAAAQMDSQEVQKTISDMEPALDKYLKA